MVAMALAQTAVHGDEQGAVLREMESAAASAAAAEMSPIWSLYEAVRADKALAGCVRMTDSSKIRDGVFGRAREEMVAVASRVRVAPEQLEERTAEMYDAAVGMTAAATVHPGKIPKFDFFLM
jgi:hypothetical protein